MAALSSRADRQFERVYRRHVDDVYRYALAVLSNRADAEDVTQTAFLNAYRAFRNGQHPERPLNWLIAITHNVCRQRFRDAARRPSEVVLDRELPAASDHDEDGGFRREDIRRALSQLTFSQRSALALRELEGRSYKEIAEVLGLTDAAVEALIFRARRAFREQLEGSLSCSDAERAISRQLDGMLARGEKGALRAHLRACPECESLARRFRAQRSALRGIVLVPLPHSLASFSGAAGSGLAGGAAMGTGLGIKVAAFGAAGLLAAGVSTEVVRHSHAGPARPAPVAVPASAQLVSRQVAPQIQAGPAVEAAAVKAVHADKHRNVHGRHRPAATVWNGQTVKPTHSISAGLTGHPPGHSTTGSSVGGSTHANGSNGTNGQGKPSDTGKPAATPGSQSPHPAKKDHSGQSKPPGASHSHATGPPPSSGAPATPSSGGPPVDVPGGGSDKGSGASGKPDDTPSGKR
jgi:RNA polymerase sigma factor (sigma-70 family)